MRNIYAASTYRNVVWISGKMPHYRVNKRKGALWWKNSHITKINNNRFKQHSRGIKKQQQGYKEAVDAYEQANEAKNDASYGHEAKQAIGEVNEASQQIENALENASETQRQRLTEFQQDIKDMENDLNQ